MKATIQNAIATIKSANSAIGKANDAVLKMLGEIKTPQDYKATRTDFVGGYGKGGEDAWERQVLKIGKAHDWKKPQSQDAKRKASARAKAPAKLKTGTKQPAPSKVKGMKTEGKAITLTMPNKAQAEELQSALAWVMENDSHKTLFVNWVKAHQSATTKVQLAA